MNTVALSKIALSARDLDLDDLHEMDEDLAEVIALKHAGSSFLTIHLNGLKTLSPETAKVLLRNGKRGWTVVLNSLVEISLALVFELTFFKGTIHCGAFSEFQDEAKELFKRFQGRLQVGAIRVQAVPDCPEVFSTQVIDPLFVLEDLDMEAHFLIGVFKGLSLVIPNEFDFFKSSLEILSQHDGGLIFRDWSRIDDETAACFVGSHVGLFFAGEVSLPSQALLHLAGHNGELWLEDVLLDKREADQILALRTGLLAVGNAELPSSKSSSDFSLDTAVHIRLRLCGDWHLRPVSPHKPTLTLEAARFITWIGCSTGEFWEFIAVPMSDAAAEYFLLSKHPVYFIPPGGTEFTPAIARLCAAHSQDLSWVRRLDEFEAKIFTAAALLSPLPFGDEAISIGVTSITEQVAELLASIPVALQFDRLSSISPQTAEVLAGCAGRALILDGLSQLDPDVAKRFERSIDWLSFDGLQNLSHAAAQSLSRHKGDLCLNGIDTLDADIAGILACHNGDLHLEGLRQISLAGAQRLAEVQGKLHFGSVAQDLPFDLKVILGISSVQ